MTTAEISETYVGAPITAGAVKSGTGLKWGIYSGTKADGTLDYVVFSDFTTVYFAASAAAHATVAASYEHLYITSSNYVILMGLEVGAQYYLVIGV